MAKDFGFEPLAVSVKEAARMLCLSERTVRDLASDGKIPSKRIGGRLIFPLVKLKQWMDDPSAVLAPGFYEDTHSVSS